jgi:hypothetical protein
MTSAVHAVVVINAAVASVMSVVQAVASIEAGHVGNAMNVEVVLDFVITVESAQSGTPALSGQRCRWG